MLTAEVACFSHFSSLNLMLAIVILVVPILRRPWYSVHNAADCLLMFKCMLPRHQNQQTSLFGTHSSLHIQACMYLTMAVPFACMTCLETNTKLLTLERPCLFPCAS